jgi:predicted O-methyltransferase YrrM
VGAPAALAGGALVLLARLVSLDVAIVVAPMVVILAVAVLMGRSAARQDRRLRLARRELRQHMSANHIRARRRARRETDRLFGQLEALAAIRDILDGRMAVPPTTDWAASADLLREVLEFVVARRPKVVVETGSGTSTIVIAACLERLREGHLWSLEHLRGYARETRDQLVAAGLQDRATVVDAPLVETALDAGTWRWYDLSGLSSIDPIELLFVDGPPGDTGPLARYPALPMLLDRLAPGAAIIVDDAARPDEREMVARWSAEVPGLEVRRLRLAKGGTLLTLGSTPPRTG